ncbi:MAG TPA: hypothetical protein VH482_21995 [Thermomicrobiales bacterium]|jgi:hypothetical protein
MSVDGDDRGSTASKLSEASEHRTLSGTIRQLVRDRSARIGGVGGLGRWLRTATGAVSAAVSLIVGILTVVFLLWPALRPESGPSTFGATLSDPRFEQGVTLADVYDRRGTSPPATYSQAQLATAGTLVGFVVVIEGFEGKTCRLTWSLFDAETHARVADETFLDQLGWPDGTFTPAAVHDQASGEVWVRRPERAGSYFVRLELFDPNGQLLTSLDSEPYEVARSTSPGDPVPGGLPTPPGRSSSGLTPGGVS